MTTDDMTKELAYEYVVSLRVEIKRLRAAVQTQGAEIDRLCNELRRALEPKP